MAVDQTLKSLASADFVDKMNLVYYGVRPEDKDANGKQLIDKGGWHYWYKTLSAGVITPDQCEAEYAKALGVG